MEYSEPKTLIEPIPILREGNRRDPATWQPFTSTPTVPFIDRGFTFHSLPREERNGEHLYPFTLINMLSEVKSRSEVLAGNGRAGVYPERCNRFGNPLTGRFLSADPYIQAPDNTQNLNRYSYCLNNPLKYSDPSGNEWWNLWFVEFMDWINDNTEDIRKQMVDADIPDFNVGFNTSFDGKNWEVYGGPDCNFNISYSKEKGWGLGTSDRYTGINRFYYPTYNYGAVEQNAMSDYSAARAEAIKDNMAAHSGTGWEFYAGTVASIGSEMYYSKTYRTWMGKDFVFRSQNWGGNGATGGKLRFGKRVSTGIKIAGYSLGLWNAYNIYSEHRDGQISDGQMYLEQGSNVFSTAGGLYGAAWSVGWEIGRVITNTEWYQKTVFNLWYNYWEWKIGPPCESNEMHWNYLLENYNQ